jgi:hypothetical protein
MKCEMNGMSGGGRDEICVSKFQNIKSRFAQKPLGVYDNA